MAINVSYTNLKTIGEEVKQYIETIDGLKNDCNAAGDAAVQAGGGTTRVGKAISAAVVTVSDEQFEAVKQIIDGFADALTKVSGLYQKYDDEVVAGIEKIAAKRQEALYAQNQTAGQAQ